ncbi:uncharacterized protein At4g02000-like [Quercus lobata]|uniref:uncharacterized protein At4g02000-like n=1 Tax=Quercus lobata TaxID=97700 RepID=UPI001244AC72|nr:uncharacterized protein At4g02000-like [Quercus lobata]
MGSALKILGSTNSSLISTIKPMLIGFLQQEPWSFDKHLVVLQRFSQDTSLENLKLQESTFWIQVHNIPPNYLDRETAKEISTTAGQVVSTKDNAESGGEGFIRVRVVVDVTQPICRGRVVTLENKKKTWVSFKYERLPNLCYWCGRLDLDDKDCELWINNEGTLEPDKKRYNSSIRALPVVSSNRNMIRVPGFFEDQIKKKTQGPGSPTREQQPPAVQINTKAPNKQTAPSKEGASFEEGLHVDNPFVSSVTATPFPVSIPISAGSQKGKEGFEETLNEIDRDIQRFDLPYTNKNAPTTSSQNSTKENSGSIRTYDASQKPISKGPSLSTPKLSLTHNIEKQAKWTRVARLAGLGNEPICYMTRGKRSLPSPTDDRPIQKPRLVIIQYDTNKIPPMAVAES